MEYPIKIEIQPEGEKTGSMVFDLATIRTFKVIKHSGEVALVELWFHNQERPMGLDGLSAQQFYEAWQGYVGNHELAVARYDYEAEEMKPGKILVARDAVGGVN